MIHHRPDELHLKPLGLCLNHMKPQGRDIHWTLTARKEEVSTQFELEYIDSYV